jgi:hypothetical protein
MEAGGTKLIEEGLAVGTVEGKISLTVSHPACYNRH